MKQQKISKREQNKINCETNILKASRRLFSRKGYNETHMTDIAKKSNISKATLYNYFPSKESLLIAIVNQMYQELQEDDAKLCKENATAERRMYGICLNLILGSMKYPELTQRIVYYHSLKSSPLFGALDPILEMLRDILVQTEKEVRTQSIGQPIEETDYSTEDRISGALECFLGMYYVTLFHSGLIFPDDLNEMERKMAIVKKTMLSILNSQNS